MQLNNTHRRKFPIRTTFILVGLLLSTSAVASCLDVTSTGKAIECLEKKIADISGFVVPSGMVAFFSAEDCPNGWTVEEKLRGRYVVGVNIGGESGIMVGTSLKDKEERPTGQHTHVFYDLNHQSGGSKVHEASSGGWGPLPTKSDTEGVIPQANLTITEGTNAPYLQLFPCRKE